MEPTYTSAVQQMRAYRTLRSYVQNILDKYDVNSSQWAILGYLHEHSQGARINELARLLDVKPPLVSVLTTSLINAKLLSVSEKEGDKRSKYLTVTPEGSAFVTEVEYSLQLHLSTLFSTVSDADMRSYKSVLQRVIDYCNV